MASYAALWRARFEMMRPGNAAMAAIGVLIGWALPAGYGTIGPVEPLLAAMLAAAAITAFGNVMNDVTDRHIDGAAHPTRPLPSGRIPLASAKVLAAVLLAFGLLQAWVAGGLDLLAFAAAVAGLLALYDLRFKRWPLIGNLTVATLVAATFAFGAVAAGTQVSSWGQAGLWSVMAMVGLSNLARELLKDMEDAGADAGRQTLPMLVGPAVVAWLATLCIGIAVGVDAGLVWTMDAWSLAGRTVLAGAAGAFIVAGGMGCYRAGLGQRALKWAMLVALIGLLLTPMGMGMVR